MWECRIKPILHDNGSYDFEFGGVVEFNPKYINKLVCTQSDECVLKQIIFSAYTDKNVEEFKIQIIFGRLWSIETLNEKFEQLGLPLITAKEYEKGLNLQIRAGFDIASYLKCFNKFSPFTETMKEDIIKFLFPNVSEDQKQKLEKDYFNPMLYRPTFKFASQTAAVESITENVSNLTLRKGRC